MRHDLSGEQLHALAGEFMRQGSGLAAGQEYPAAEFLQVLLKFLAHGSRAAHDGEDALFYIVPGFLLR